MNLLQILLTLYLLTGVVYAGYVLTQRSFSIFMLPVNIIGGPILAIYYLIKYYLLKDRGPANIRHKDILKGKKAAFFDLDGTIWDSDALWIEALEKVARENGLGGIDVRSTYLPGTELTKIWKILQAYNRFKLPDKKNYRVLAKETETKIINHINNSAQVDLIEGFNDIAFFLKEDKGLKLALVTNSSKEIAVTLAQKTGVAYMFDLILTGSEVVKKKPSPRIFLKAAGKLHVSPKSVLVFEDSPSGSRAAKKAGMDQIIIWRNDTPQEEYRGNIYGFYPDFEGLDKIISKTSRQRMLEGIDHVNKSIGRIEVAVEQPPLNQET
ncbi:MAG: HAD-superfamily hydrolase, subfamily IA, variant 3 [candidate division WWE3 bacterium GW2011_GWD2_42_11]|nr:MAG: HAD-superfamily hydrolase, subfamily IA, variant 3 [candidate division WWE3 bacterium GW2011_GWD2_42_11]